ncbi:hypothetical protein [Tepidibacter hydrothermalis]|uniref:Uncharacterized protein n=1 Tax=Tepidibacter hydrothermalis TaxID=3036126 RepID=A0ABY8EHS8_9FIRM|nr:hypothetical protein [Tepidibacter hydrothermalis]WFD11324.1 hypothetical protein P4S50_04400 [Tepidibacter hydrothermalis]
MSELITEIYSQNIMNYDSYNQKIISLIGILEGYLYKVSKKHFRNINSKKIEEVTLSELGLIYNNYFYKNTGMNGVCWEYAVFYAIYYNETYIQDLINMAINYLSGENTCERINAILWGAEKTTISLDNIKSSIKDDEMIWSPIKEYNFKDYIDLIKNSFYSKKLRDALPNNIKDIWKTDLFVKKESSNTWYAVTVKWNGHDVKYHEGLSIGIYFEFANSPKRTQNPYPITNIMNKNYFVYCSIPFIFNFGEYYTYIFRLVNNILSKINCNKSNSMASTFATGEEYNIFQYFYKNKDASCIQLIYYLKNYYSYYINTIESNEIILATDRKITCNPFINTTLGEKEKGIKIIPK